MTDMSHRLMLLRQSHLMRGVPPYIYSGGLRRMVPPSAG
jgi:hypothetical protein